ncbi:MAG: tRNA (adenosine(37)-N6)-threonylcarbamoyltransferase complex ATPase subunit type 1 TsaE [Patescibacteria group bacterium]
MESKQIILSGSYQDTYDLGVNVAENLKSGKYGHRRVVCLRGILGSGKTVFVKGFLEGYGVSSRILSPTFTISRMYEIQNRILWHYDLYRMKDASEVIAIGIKEVLSDETTIVLIEWAEKIQELLPQTRIDIYLDVTGDSSRKIEVHVLGNI